MRIFIITMEDPIHHVSFIKKIIENRKNDIVGVAVAKGDRLLINKKKSKLVYLFSLMLIMGLFPFIKNIWITITFKIKRKLSKKIKGNP